MSDNYKLILKIQRAVPKAREAVNKWLQEHVHPDCASLQSIVLDEGELLEGSIYNKDKIYELLVPIAQAAKSSPSDEIIRDPEYDAELAAHEGKDVDFTPKPRLLNNDLTEARVRFIVRQEIARIINRGIHEKQ